MDIYFQLYCTHLDMIMLLWSFSGTLIPNSSDPLVILSGNRSELQPNKQPDVRIKSAKPRKWKKKKRQRKHSRNHMNNPFDAEQLTEISTQVEVHTEEYNDDDDDKDAPVEY